jgi:broad specificity phosphatase PhoE
MELRMIRIFAIGFLLLGFQNTAHSQVDNDVFSIYLVRHAEKDSEAKNPEDPTLSTCGELRAKFLARVLSDIELEKIYSTAYERTLGTAQPSADSHQLEIEIYDPHKLEEFSRELLNAQQDALVVGHSNTTGVLAGMLAGEIGEAFAEEIYDRLYQVNISGDHARINLLHQDFNCEP